VPPPASAAPTPKTNGNQFIHFGKIADISNAAARQKFLQLKTARHILNFRIRIAADNNSRMNRAARKVCEKFHLFGGVNDLDKFCRMTLLSCKDFFGKSKAGKPGAL
jgi:hypothetical protein